MNPGLLPAKRQSMPRMNVTREQAVGKAARYCILIIVDALNLVLGTWYLVLVVVLQRR